MAYTAIHQSDTAPLEDKCTLKGSLEVLGGKESTNNLPNPSKADDVEGRCLYPNSLLPLTSSSNLHILKCHRIVIHKF